MGGWQAERKGEPASQLDSIQPDMEKEVKQDVQYVDEVTELWRNTLINSYGLIDVRKKANQKQT